MNRSGFGTNFHKVYKNEVKLYDEFSCSEKFSGKLNEEIKNRIVGKVLLDVACGTCHKTNQLSKYFEKIFALDISEELLDYGRFKYKNNKKINHILSSASKIPLLDGSVDTVFVSWGSFPLSKTIREMKRVLVSGGVILRIGILGKDNFTSLFPGFDSARIKRIHRKFIEEDFLMTEHKVKIEFSNIKDAKRILSGVLGVEKESVNMSSYEHKVGLYVYKKK